MDEALEVVSRLWREEKVDFAGTHFHLQGASIAPKPVQAELPLWIGGSSDAAIRRTGRYGTGWQAGLDSIEDIARIIPAIKQAATEAGRAIDEDHYGAGLAFHFGSADDPGVTEAKARVTRAVGRDMPSYFAIGDAAAILARIEELVAAGASKFILRPLLPGDDSVLDQTRRLVEELLPRVSARWPRGAPISPPD
jgi:alkanesulfonate monooxygenase SsuD/methylene tetrahydromethanopterin reductase-like flavin-dependent oxidoreductase (luciferase family)